MARGQRGSSALDLFAAAGWPRSSSAGSPAPATLLAARPRRAPSSARSSSSTATPSTSANARVRLFGIDAPELTQRGGWKARGALIGLAGGHEVAVEPVDLDCYGRIVARVWLGRPISPTAWSATASPVGITTGAPTTPPPSSRRAATCAVSGRPLASPTRPPTAAGSHQATPGADASRRPHGLAPRQWQEPAHESPHRPGSRTAPLPAGPRAATRSSSAPPTATARSPARARWSWC